MDVTVTAGAGSVATLMRLGSPILQRLPLRMRDTANANTAAAPHTQPPPHHPRSGPQNDINGRGGRPRRREPPYLACWRAGANGGRRPAAHSHGLGSAGRQLESACSPPLLPPVACVQAGRRREGWRRRAADGRRRAASLRRATEGGARTLHRRHACAAMDTGLAAG